MKEASLLLILVAILSSTFAKPRAQTCPPEGAPLLPHPEDCTKYIVCNHGFELILSCPTPLYFNPRLELCDFQINVPECMGGTRPPSTTTTTTEPTTSTTTPESTTSITSTAKPGPVVTNCGDIIAANSGSIEYKLSEDYEADELCSFVIRTPDHNGIVFTLHSHGINETWDLNAINIFTFNADGLIDSVHLGPPNPLMEGYLSGGLAVVVFKTKTNKGSGFSLSFQGIGTTSYLKGIDRVYSEPGNLTVPSWPNYGGTVNIIILSNNHKVVKQSLSTFRLKIEREDFEDNMTGSSSCGWDALRIFSFNDKLVEEEKFCNILSQKSVFQTNGLFIMVYRKFEENYWYTKSGDLRWDIVKT